MKNLNNRTTEELKAMIGRAYRNLEVYLKYIDDDEVLEQELCGVIEEAEDLIRFSKEILDRVQN